LLRRPGPRLPSARLRPRVEPTENLWSSLKRGLANVAAGSIKDVTRITKNRLKRMQYRPALANGFRTATGLAPP
jgi:hypothetical protein